MTDATAPGSGGARRPLPRWTEWLTLGLAASAWGSFCLLIVTKQLESPRLSTWGLWLKRTDIALVFMMAAPMLAFASLASYVALRAAGRHTRRNTLGLLVGFGFLLGFVLLTLPWPHAARERARRTKCTSNLKQIGYACQLYAEENAGAFPPDLGALHPEIVSDSELYACPSAWLAGRIPDSRSDEFLPEAVCYAYVSGLRAMDDGDIVLAFDEEWNHGGDGMNVAQIGGRVEWVRDVDALHARLDEQKAALAAKGRSMKIIRPPWSRWPDPPEYPVRPWHERPVVMILMIAGGLVIAALVVGLTVRARRRAATAASAGGSADSPSDGC